MADAPEQNRSNNSVRARFHLTAAEWQDLRSTAEEGQHWANEWWMKYGRPHGFDWTTVEDLTESGEGAEFTAIPLGAPPVDPDFTRWLEVAKPKFADTLEKAFAAGRMAAAANFAAMGRVGAGGVFPIGWVVWSNEHQGWWRPGRCGYTTHLGHAGVYREAEAKAICRNPERIGQLPHEICAPFHVAFAQGPGGMIDNWLKENPSG